jgi:hypothetical protein
MESDIIDIGTEENLPAVQGDLEAEISGDIEEARTTYKELIEKGKEGIEVAYGVMQGSEHPRAIEVFATLINAIASINKNLVELQVTKRETSKRNQKQEQTTGSQNIQTNVFVGSPADLQNLISGMNFNKGLSA